MLIDFRNKKSKKKQKKDTDHEELSTTTEPNIGKTSTDLTDDDELNGVEFKEYAKRRGLHTTEVWRLIRDGQLVARTENGFVYVYGIDKKSTLVPMKTVRDLAKDEDAITQTLTSEDLPPLPTDSDIDNLSKVPATVTDERSPEVDHLLESLQNLQTENREILKLSKDSVSQITEISKKAIQAKDEIIDHKNSLLADKQNTLATKEEKLNSLQEKISTQERELNRLKQENEDLEMLNRTLSANI